MEEGILSEIAEAEAEGARKKAEAAERAAALLAEADRDAAERTRLSELDCAILRAEGLKRAEQEAQREYDRAIAACRETSRKYAESSLEDADVYVAEIVGRLLK